MKARGFTLVELVVAITVSSIVVIFATMFIGAPVGAGLPAAKQLLVDHRREHGGVPGRDWPGVDVGDLIRVSR